MLNDDLMIYHCPIPPPTHSSHLILCVELKQLEESPLRNRKCFFKWELQVMAMWSSLGKEQIVWLESSSERQKESE